MLPRISRQEISAFHVRPGSAFQQCRCPASSSQLHLHHLLPHLAFQHRAKVGECLYCPYKKKSLQAFSQTLSLSGSDLCRWRTMPHPGHHCLASMTTRRHRLWCPLSPKRPRSSATHRCGGSNGNQTKGRGTGNTLPMETVRYSVIHVIPSTSSFLMK